MSGITKETQNLTPDVSVSIKHQNNLIKQKHEVEEN